MGKMPLVAWFAALLCWGAGLGYLVSFGLSGGKSILVPMALFIVPACILAAFRLLATRQKKKQQILGIRI